jgi:hypothetical protein
LRRDPGYTLLVNVSTATCPKMRENLQDLDTQDDQSWCQRIRQHFRAPNRLYL